MATLKELRNAYLYLTISVSESMAERMYTDLSFVTDPEVREDALATAWDFAPSIMHPVTERFYTGQGYRADCDFVWKMKEIATNAFIARFSELRAASAGSGNA